MHQAGADDEHLTSSRCSCRGDPYRFIAVLGSALPLNAHHLTVHHRTCHVPDSKTLHDLCLLGAGAGDQDWHADARSVWTRVEPGASLAESQGIKSQ